MVERENSGKKDELPPQGVLWVDMSGNKPGSQKPHVERRLPDSIVNAYMRNQEAKKAA